MKDHLIKRILVSITGLILCGVGISLFLYSGLGVDPASTFELGLANVLNISYGGASVIVHAVILTAVLFIDKKYINISSVLAIFGIGYTVDFVEKFLYFMEIGNANIPAKLILVVLGLFVMSVGVATYIAADLGISAIDIISEIIHRKTGVQYRIIRITGDVAFVILGYLLGGEVGVGTIIAAVLLGMGIQFVRPYVVKMTEGFIYGMFSEESAKA